MFRGTLIASGQNAKTTKGDDVYETAIMYLAPADLATSTTLCAMADLAGCKAGCLNSAGRGAFDNVKDARARKARWYETDRDGFMTALVRDVAAFVRYCERRGRKPAVRLNGTSDIPFERIPVVRPLDPQGRTERHANIMAAFPGVQFYDYTKMPKRLERTIPENYHLTLSWSEASGRYAELVLDGMAFSDASVAVVFRDKATRQRAMAQGFLGRSVIDGDRDDLRFLDPQGVVVGLYAKGRAKRDTSGFVVDLD